MCFSDTHIFYIIVIKSYDKNKNNNAVQVHLLILSNFPYLSVTLS